MINYINSIPFDVTKATGYSSGPSVQYPGVLISALFLPFHSYYSIQGLLEAFKKSDFEGMFDAFFNCIGLPGILSYIIGKSILYAHLSKLVFQVPLTSIYCTLGIGAGWLCASQLILEGMGLIRQATFQYNFHFSTLSSLNTLIFNLPTSPKTIQNAVTRIAAFVQQNPQLFHTTDSDQAHPFHEWIDAYISQPKAGRYLFIKEKSSDCLQTIATTVLIDHFKKINDQYLKLQEKEAQEIEKGILKKNPTLNEDQLNALKQTQMEDCLEKKWKNLGRRITPLMASVLHEAVHKYETIGGLQEAIQVNQDVWIQSQKKKLVYILGIITLIFAIISLVYFFVTAPIALPWIFAGLTFTFGCLRFGLFSTTLESKGWTVEPEKIIPLWIRKKFFSQSSEAR